MFRNAFVLLLLVGLGSLYSFADTVNFNDIPNDVFYEGGNSFADQGSTLRW